MFSGIPKIEGALQEGLIIWASGQGSPPTWEALLEAMQYAGIALQYINDLKSKVCSNFR